MSGIKISDLLGAATLTGAELFELSQAQVGIPVSRSASLSDIGAFLGAAATGYIPLTGTVSGSPLTGTIEYAGASGSSALSSTTTDFYTGTGDTLDLDNSTIGNNVYYGIPSANRKARLDLLGNRFLLTAKQGSANTKLDANALGGYIQSTVFDGTNAVAFTMNATGGVQLNASDPAFTFTGDNDWSANSTSLSFIQQAYGDANYYPLSSNPASYLTTSIAGSTYMPLSGGTFTGNVNGVSPTELSYVSGITSNIQNQINNINLGMSWKVSARASTITNITLSGTQTVDGVSLAVGDRCLVKNQTTSANNGIYVVASGNWTRSADATTGGSLPGSTSLLGSTIAIEEGTINADSIWICTTNAPITIGTTTLAFAKTSATTYTASNGVSLSSNNFTIDNTYFTGDVSLSGGAATVNSIQNKAITLATGLLKYNGTAFSFDNSAYITGVTGTTNRVTVTGGTAIDIASTYVGQSSITTLGTIGTGVWNGTSVGPTFGGTGQSTVTTGDMLYGSASNTWSKLSSGATAGMFLRNGGASTAPTWSTLILPNAATANRVAYATSTNTWGESANLTFSGTRLGIGAFSGTTQASWLHIVGTGGGSIDAPSASNALAIVGSANDTLSITSVLKNTNSGTSAGAITYFYADTAIGIFGAFSSTHTSVPSATNKIGLYAITGSGLLIGTRNAQPIQFLTNDVIMANMSSAGMLYVGGSTTATARVNIAAGTALAGTAPLKLTVGVILTTPEAGVIENDSSHIYYTAGSTRYQLDQQGVSNYAHTIFTPTTGGTVSLVKNQYNIINPAGALLALTVNLPSSPSNNDVVFIKFTQNVTTVTYGNGTVVDGITAPTAGGLTVLVYDSGITSWY